MKTMITRAGAGVLLGAVLATSACGGESQADKRVKELSGLTHAQFVSKLDKFCSENDNAENAEDKKNSEALEQAFLAEDGDRMADLLDGIIDEAEPYVDKLHDVEPPAEDQQAYDRYLESTDDAIETFRSFIEGLRNGDGVEWTTWMAMSEKVDQITKKGNAAVTDLGALECVDKEES